MQVLSSRGAGGVSEPCCDAIQPIAHGNAVRCSLVYLGIFQVCCLGARQRDLGGGLGGAVATLPGEAAREL